jgi:hypothetical protein
MASIQQTKSFQQQLIEWVVVGLKVLAIMTVLGPVLARHVFKVVTVYMQAGPASLNRPGPQRSYSYFTGFHMLNFADIKWDLIEGIALYAVALAIQYTAARMIAHRPAKGGSAF